MYIWLYSGIHNMEVAYFQVTRYRNNLYLGDMIWKNVPFLGEDIWKQMANF